MINRRLLGAIGALAIVASACGGSTTTPAPTTGGATTAPGETATAPASQPAAAGDQVLKLYLSSDDPATLDPNAAQDAVSIAILGEVTRGLLYYDKDLNVVPSLATDLPEVTDGGKTMTFHLRQDAKYSDGNPIVAGDLVYSWKRLVDPRQANPYAYVMCPVAGADKLLGADNGCGTDPTPTDDAAIEAGLASFGVEAPDDYTFIVHLAQPATYFTAIASMWLTVPLEQKWIETPDFTEAQNFVSSGPFMLAGWDHNSQIVLKPNPNWYGDPPKLSEVDYQIGGDVSAAVASYERGDIDMVLVAAGSDIVRVGDDPSLADQIHDQASLGITYYDYANCGQPKTACPDHGGATAPTTNKDFRIALTQSVDKQAFIDLTFGGIGAVANGIIMPGLPGYDADYNPYPYDTASAQQHLQAALQELGTTDTNGDGNIDALDLGKLTIGYNKDAGHLPRVAFLAEAWRTALGFDESQFDFVGVDFPTLLQQRLQGKYDVSRDAWGADFPSAHNQLAGLFTCGGGNNDSQYCNPQFDQLIAQADAEPDQTKAADLYQQAQRLLVDDAGVLPLRYGVTRFLVKPYVQGVEITSIDSENPGDRLLEKVSLAAH
jgi:ABC-type oligopeptide transport system substrate-binding subunit